MRYNHLQNVGRTVASLAITVSLSGVLGACGLMTSREEAPAQSAPVAETKSEANKSEVTEYEPMAYDTEEFVVSDDAMGLMASSADEYGSIEEGVPFNTEEYDSLEETGFISTATRPLSTISSDVDTASYCNLRRMLRDGWTADEIDAGAVRIEELLNYFDYDYATPKGDDLFATTVHLGDCPWNKETKLLTIGFATAPEAASVAEKGSNLVFLIDISGSMDSPDKLGLLKDSFDELVSHLDKNDRVSIVTYANGQDIVLEGARGDEGRKIMRAINRLRADGATNGEAGLKMAYEVAQRNYIEGGVNRIVMASDGDLNVGMSSESDLHDYVDQQRETGIYLSVLGFGSGNYKDNKMEALADAGNGNYHYIDCLDEAVKVFGTDLVANLVPLANDVKLQVEFNPAHVKAYRLIGYENRALADEDFRDDTKDAGDIGPGHQLTVAYEIVPADSKMEVPEADLKYGEGGGGDPSSSEWLTCTMRYQPVARADGDGFVVEQGEAREQSLTVSEANYSDNPGDDWTFAASIIEAGMVLRDSEFKGTATLDSVKELLSGLELNAERRGFEKLVDML